MPSSPSVRRWSRSDEPPALMASLSTALIASVSFYGALVRRAVAGRDRRGLALGRQQRAVERFADIDVAETRDDALIAERRLQAGLLAGAGFRQHRGIEFIAERLRPDRTQQRIVVELARGTSFMKPKRRGSLKVTVVPDDMWKTTWSCAKVLGALMMVSGRASSLRRCWRHETSPTCRDASTAPHPTKNPPAGIWRGGRAQ